MIEIRGGKTNSNRGCIGAVGGGDGGLSSLICSEKVKDYSIARNDVHGPHASFIVGFSLKLDCFFVEPS